MNKASAKFSEFRHLNRQSSVWWNVCTITRTFIISADPYKCKQCVLTSSPSYSLENGRGRPEDGVESLKYRGGDHTKQCTLNRHLLKLCCPCWTSPCPVCLAFSSAPIPACCACPTALMPCCWSSPPNPMASCDRSSPIFWALPT